MDLSTYVRRDISGIRRDLLPLSGFGLLSHALAEEIAARNLASEGFYHSTEMEFLQEPEPEAAPEPRPVPRRPEPLRLDLTLLLKLIQQSSQPPLTAGSEKLLERVRTILVTDAGIRPVSGPALRGASRPAVRQTQTMELELRGSAGDGMRNPLRDPKAPITQARQSDAPREVVRASDHAMRFADVLRRAQGEGLTFATVKGGVPRSAQTRTAYQDARQKMLRPAQAEAEEGEAARPVWQRHSPEERSAPREQTRGLSRPDAERQIPPQSGLPEVLFAPRYAEAELQLAQDAPPPEATAHPVEPRFAREAAQSLRETAAALTESAAAALREVRSEPPAVQKEAPQKLQTQSVGLVENAASPSMPQKAEERQTTAQANSSLRDAGSLTEKAEKLQPQKENVRERSTPEKQELSSPESPSENEPPRRPALQGDRSVSTAETLPTEAFFAPRYAEAELQLAQDAPPPEAAAHPVEPHFAREAAQSLREAAAALTESAAAALREMRSEPPAVQKEVPQKLQTQRVETVENTASPSMPQKAEECQTTAQTNSSLQGAGSLTEKAEVWPQSEDIREHSTPEKQGLSSPERPAENESPRRSALRGDRSVSTAETASAEALFAPRYAEAELQLAQDVPPPEAAAHPVEPRFAREAAQSLRETAAVLTESAAAALREVRSERSAVQKEAPQKLQTQRVETVENTASPSMPQKAEERQTTAQTNSSLQGAGSLTEKAEELRSQKENVRERSTPEKQELSASEKSSESEPPRRPALQGDRSVSTAETASAEALFAPRYAEAELQLAQDVPPPEATAHPVEPRFAREAAQSLRETAAALTESAAAALREMRSEPPAAQKEVPKKLQTPRVETVENTASPSMPQKAEERQTTAQTNSSLQGAGSLTEKAEELQPQKENVRERSTPEKQEFSSPERPVENELPRRSALRGDRSVSTAETASTEALFVPRYAEAELQLAQDVPPPEAAAHPAEPRFAREAAQSLRETAAALTESAAAALRETVPELTRAAVQATVREQKEPTPKGHLASGLASAQIPVRENVPRPQTVQGEHRVSAFVRGLRPRTPTAAQPASMPGAEPEPEKMDALFSPLRGEAGPSELTGPQAAAWPSAPGYGETALEHRTEGPLPVEADALVTGNAGGAEPAALLWLGEKIAGNAARELAKIQRVSAGRKSLSGTALSRQPRAVSMTVLPFSGGQPTRSFGMAGPVRPGASGTAGARMGTLPEELVYTSPEQSAEPSSAAVGAEGLVRTLDRLLRASETMRPRELRTLSRKIGQNSPSEREMRCLSGPAATPHPAELPTLRYQTGRPEPETISPPRGAARPAGAEDTLEGQRVYPVLSMEYSSPLDRMEEQIQTAVARQMELSARPIGTQTGAGQYMAAKASPGGIKTLDQMSPPPASGQMVWQNPYLRAAPSEMTYRQKKQPPEQPVSAPRPQPLRVSDAELRRMADQVYRLVKDAIRQERRRMGL